ncbi:hypothetical protein J3459_006123 [Metarhizium acridum]|uniref:uncharacterized protein n=1 Tax=Metarhizium acridum TaxID=92637 RepID=UPI001C6C2AC5|nr:hypothetical protein J3458_005559 [Metarhizium acridum]KAG8428036.1 hypothetical protein J3459_006123 [Metarhizium acridum]
MYVHILLHRDVPFPHAPTPSRYYMYNSTRDSLLHAPPRPDEKPATRKIKREHGTWHGVAAERSGGRAERLRGGPSSVALELNTSSHHGPNRRVEARSRQ